jgi:hypothetical protein
MVLIRDVLLIVGASGTLYAATVTATALISVLAPTAERRRDALKALKILLPPLR